MIRRLDSTASSFGSSLERLLRIPVEDQAEVRGIVSGILADVRQHGDDKLVELTNSLDRRSVEDVSGLIISRERMQQAYETIDAEVAGALKLSVDRVWSYHEQQLAASGGGNDWDYKDDLGNRLGQKVCGMQRVGLYAPGGKASYPSTVIMTAIPASVAGVEELVLCVPMPGGEINETLLAAAWLCDVDHVFSVGGAQAIAAMAYGTDTIPRVDKIVGPGNIFVATAKEMVYGDVGIDMIAGPSEVLIIADDTADPNWIIHDMFAQAEHDEMAQSILVSASPDLLDQVEARMPQLLSVQNRRQIVESSISKRGALIQVTDLDQAFELANRIAPEHLQLALAGAGDYLGRVRWAGAVFLGVNTAEVVGDYTAGPSHVLPTNGTARFASPLGVYDFQVRTSVIECSAAGAEVLNRSAAVLADEEGLSAHAESARDRVEIQDRE